MSKKDLTPLLIIALLLMPVSVLAQGPLKVALLPILDVLPFHVAESFTGTAGKYCKVEDTVKGFRGICDGDYDELPEQAFYMVGGIEEVLAKAEKMAAVE